MSNYRNELPTERLNLLPSERDDYGVTITIRHEDGRQQTFAEQGRVVGAMRKAAARIDAMEEPWKIVTVSTPATIFGDLQGSRDTEFASSPELNLLAKIGRQDLAVTGMSDKAIRNRRKRANRTPAPPKETRAA